MKMAAILNVFLLSLPVSKTVTYSCEVGYYGRNCTNKCDHCKNSVTCGVQNGECDALDCRNDGYQPPLCKECKRGKYGLNCKKQCSHFCIDDDCHKTDGTCVMGCKKGYRGNICIETCQEGWYGLNCSETCGNCLKDTICHHVTGTCPKGCAAGYKAQTCKTPCNDGKYGMNCRFNCSRHCLVGEVCNKTDGSCRSCADGYTGIKCDTECKAGKYGNSCSESCGACLHSTGCNHITGDCKLGCEPGWQKTAKCKTACINGTFGLSCKHNCSGNCLNEKPCNSIDGTCSFCSQGWENIWCNKSTLQMDVSFPGTIDLTVLLLIVCPVAGLLFIALCVVTVVFLLRHRKRKQKNETTNEKFQEIEDQDNEDEESPETLDDTNLYTTVQIRSKSIKTTDLPSVIKSMGSDTDKGFTEEFNSIPYGEQSDIICTVGKLPENIPKNRFKTTFPYDHSRVVLQSSKNGDYINANFIKNTYGDAVYIASQGPKPKTVGDFWQMVWQENVFVIVMVTNLKEGDKIKCERYWPTSGDSNMVLEIFTVQLFSERIYANFSIHNLKLFNRETQETRQITHLQYTSWPDHGTPNPLELLSFYHYVSRALEQHPGQKLVVHCSAGIGRTGTFIALDALHRQGVKKGKINIVEYVHTMREDRMNMIQNLNQYKFLYHSLYESFRAGCHVLRKENFVQEMEAHIKSDKATNLSNFRTEFKELDSMKRIFDESEKQIGLQNLKLNMTENVLPADKMRIILSSHAQERGTYYNAVPISTFTTKDCIIAGQYPVQGAGIDLIRLLVDQECSSLILTHPLSEIPHSGSWFSGPLFNYRVEVGPMNKLSADVNKYNVRIKPPSSKGLHKVSMYEITAWNPTENLPQVLLDAVKRIQLCELVDPERKLTILSRDGASICGEFCAVYNAIQQLQQDQEVDMFTIVRQLQSRRPEMISDLNGYLLCCQAVAEFMKSDSEDTYMNSVSNTVTVEENMYANT
ncbi:receptor-type tyrosine-protein phosphatase alpha-like isoform X2 [Magallana gigas]|uniref:receptor-type tyrosine-protein phosphatase alpha-like isoform X2 n=1 Tax=Magallana gigas TaxID=29159 RepID=UPI003340AA11